MRDLFIGVPMLNVVDVGETKALASVSGPMEVRLAQEQASKATFEVNVRPLAGIPGEHLVWNFEY